jgi:ABC-type nickel/cobalt efflux system permease component RcnA
MSNSHGEKYVSNLLMGFAAVTSSIFLLLFIIFEKSQKDDWFIWGIVASLLMCIGLYLIVLATVHKVKAELIKKQRERDRHNSQKANAA